MTVRRAGPRVPAGERELRAMDAQLREDEPRRRASKLERLLDVVDRTLGREDAGDVEIMLLQAFATAWALLGYAIWLGMWLTWRVLVAIARALASPWRRRDRDEGWTTTIKRRGLPR